jgi:hypothetical protein
VRQYTGGSVPAPWLCLSSCNQGFSATIVEQEDDVVSEAKGTYFNKNR